MNYDLSYNFDSQLNCGIIRFNDKFVLMDLPDLFSIINFDKNFIYYNPAEKDYPYYLRHNQKICYLNYLFKYDSSNIDYVFKNGNKYDLRRGNVIIIIQHEIFKNIINKYEVIDFELGHYNDNGKDAYVMKNPIWKIKENNKEFLLMFCEKETICKLCYESYKKILEFEKTHNNKKKLTWYKQLNGYIATHFMDSCIYIHQIIMDCYGNGKGTKNISVDHIDQDPLNNTLANLRIATRKEQEQNSKGIKDGTKRARKSSAKQLPEGITQDMMKKYVVYYHEWLNKEHTREREFFKVEKHPKLDKIWISSKSNNLTIQEKLAQANKVVEDLENNIYPVKDEIQLPKYISLVNFREKPHLVFEKRYDGKRLNLKMILPDEYDIDEQLSIFQKKINEKYGDI
jgi:hypothetical protein